MIVFEFARQKESQAEHTYRICAERADNIGLRTIFTMLANAEKRHLEVIKKMENEETANLVDGRLLRDAQSILEQMRPLADVFEAADSQVELYREARESEEASEDFYLAQSQITQNTHNQRLFLALAAEEHEHYLVLNSIIEFASSPEARMENAVFQPGASVNTSQ